MRARIFYGDGSVERVPDVVTVTETADAFEFITPNGGRPLCYPKSGRGVSYVQLVWHAD